MKGCMKSMGIAVVIGGLVFISSKMGYEPVLTQIFGSGEERRVFIEVTEFPSRVEVKVNGEAKSPEEAIQLVQNYLEEGDTVTLQFHTNIRIENFNMDDSVSKEMERKLFEMGFDLRSL